MKSISLSKVFKNDSETSYEKTKEIILNYMKKEEGFKLLSETENSLEIFHKDEKKWTKLTTQISIQIEGNKGKINLETKQKYGTKFTIFLIFCVITLFTGLLSLIGLIGLGVCIYQISKASKENIVQLERILNNIQTDISF